MVFLKNQWNWKDFSNLIPMLMTMVIASYPPPSTGLEEDFIYWHNFATGNF
jgi:hypothetical protein